MPPYDAERFAPPAPVALVSLREARSRRSARNVSLLVDTGADVTLLPRDIVLGLGVSPIEDVSVELLGFDGSFSGFSDGMFFVT